MKTGLILEGGAMRGMFTAGVTDVFLDENIYFDSIYAVSAGACFGCSYKSKQKGRALRYNLKYCRDKRYCSLYSLITTGDLYGVKFCYEDLPKKLDIFDDEAYNNDKSEFYAVCTDVETGEALYIRCDKSDEKMITAIRASASMPLVSRIVELDGRKLLDGGVADSVPIKKAQESGCEKCVVILTQPKGYIKKKNPLMKFSRIVLGKYPNLLKAMENRHTVYNETTAYIESEEEKGNIFVIRPPRPLDISRTEHNPEKLQSAYDLGAEEASKCLSHLKEYLGYENS